MADALSKIERLMGELAEAQEKLAEVHLVASIVTLKRHGCDPSALAESLCNVGDFDIIGAREASEMFARIASLAVPPPAESTPVQRESSCRDPTECADGQCARTLYGAPPDDIRERLERLEEWASMREHGPLRLAAMEAKGEPGTTFCDEHGREDCGRPDHTKGAKP